MRSSEASLSPRKAITTYEDWRKVTYQTQQTQTS